MNIDMSGNNNQGISNETHLENDRANSDIVDSEILKSNLVGVSKTPCHCGSRNCRGFLPLHAF